MLYANIIIIIFLLFLYIKSLKYTDNMLSTIDRKKHKLYFLYPMAGLFLAKTGLEKKLVNKIDISRKIRALYITDHHDFQIKLYWFQKTSLFLFIIFAFSCISMITSLQTSINKPQIFEDILIRPEVGEGDKNLSLRFRMENETDIEDVYEDEISIQNRERIYSDREWEEVLDKAITYLEQELLGENQDLKHVDRDLNLIKKIPDTSIVIEWVPQNYRLISSNGKLMNEDISDQGTDTLIRAILKYEDKRVEHTIPLTLWPVKSDHKELLYKELQNILDISDKETEKSREWRLPQKIGDYILTWQIPDNNPAFSVLILGIVGSLILWVLMDRTLDNKMKLRNNQMLLDYPEIINKFNLLVNAGMTIRQAWNKVVEDYNENIKLFGGQRRYAYEEMRLTLHELKLGVSEVNAYEQFGIRIGLMPFMKLSSILVQNLKKGNKSMIDLLKREAAEAFQERKETTKRLGEEASTKLLGPMMILLLIVLIIILMPAFISFQI
ncbi:MAG: hypothetical protein EWM47_02100 [Anaerolineaceae bacterium]|nr:MAG: hypothetical protein EWM47_02100 [Anaerolineaceae bacterium]